jgi:hypothetical protein
MSINICWVLITNWHGEVSLTGSHSLNACFVKSMNTAQLGYLRIKDSLRRPPISIIIILVLLLLDGLCLVGFLRLHPFALPQLRSLVENLLRPFLHLRQYHLLGHPGELGQVEGGGIVTFIFHHLQDQLHLVNVVNEVAFWRLAIFVLLPHLPYARAVLPSVYSPQQALANVVHCFCFSPALLNFRNVVYWCQVTNQGFRHVVNQGHLRTMWDV